jgi:hypothetical protein
LIDVVDHEAHEILAAFDGGLTSARLPRMLAAGSMVL